MRGEAVSPLVQVLPLVQPVGAGVVVGGFEVGGGASVQVSIRLGVPRMTHVSNGSISTLSGGTAGGGGIGLVVLRMRPSASCAIDFDGSTFEGATRSA